MIGPLDLKEKDRNKYNVENIVVQIDEIIEEQHGYEYFERCVLSESIPFHIRNNIAELYLNVGWKYIYHTTSYELDNSGDYTIFIFSEYEIDEFSNYFRVTKNHNPTCITNPFIILKDGKSYE